MKPKFRPIIFFLLIISVFSFSDKTVTVRSDDFLPKEEWIAQQLQALTLEEKIAQSFMVSFSPNDKQSKEAVLNQIKNNRIGGVVFYNGDTEVLKAAIHSFQSASKVPLFMSIDGEAGIGMRVKDVMTFPQPGTFAAANDPYLTRQLAYAMAGEFRELGFNLNLAPVADIVSPNSVIGARSFGSSVEKIERQVTAIVEGFSENAVLTTLKHFPGHGTTTGDSRTTLPLLDHDRKTLEKYDFPVYKSVLKKQLPAILVGHLKVPALDDVPASLSAKVIKELLRSEFQFKGLVISNGMDMLALKEFGEPAELNLKAYKAGCDLLLNTKAVEESIQLIKKEIDRKKISIEEINEKVSRILSFKYDYVYRVKNIPVKEINSNEVSYFKNKVAEKAVTMVKNEADFFPFTTHNVEGLIVSAGNYTYPFTSMMSNLTNTQILSFKSLKDIGNKLDKYKHVNQFLLTLHLENSSEQEISEIKKELPKFLLEHAPKQARKGLVVFGSPFILTDTVFLDVFESVVFAYENTGFVQNRTAQVICGALPMQGKLPYHLHDRLNVNAGITYPALNRLSFSDPEEFKLSREKLGEIDTYIQKCISEGVFPGCQVAFAYKGKVIYNKSFGKLTYEGNEEVQNDDIYDLASVTKIVSSTSALMYLQSKGKFTLDKKLVDYLPELVENSVVKNIVLRSMMAHQAGFKAFIPFYKRTMLLRELKASVYNKEQTDFYSKQVAANLWIDGNYRDTMMAELLRTPLGTPGKYLYSDLGYYFVQRIVEKEANTTLDKFVLQHIYEELGLNRTGYNPLSYYPLSKIAPTENDTLFRKQLVHGFVHDPGAAMQGGVAGHAGVFSNATDLLAVLQMFMNKGSYAGKELIKKEVVEEYTRAQFSGNRRGAGFDRPAVGNPKSPACDLVSAQSYGHSGFTGTYVWVDPKNELIFVFLSNRVYPDAENWKITQQGVRPKIHRMFYELIQGK